MTYGYTCPRGCGESEVDVPVTRRDEVVFCQCGAPMKRLYRFAVHVPLHMRAGHEDVVRQIMPQGPDGVAARKQWLEAAVAQGVHKRYHHDLEG